MQGVYASQAQLLTWLEVESVGAACRASYTPQALHKAFPSKLPPIRPTLHVGVSAQSTWLLVATPFEKATQHTFRVYTEGLARDLWSVSWGSTCQEFRCLVHNCALCWKCTNNGLPTTQCRGQQHMEAQLYICPVAGCEQKAVYGDLTMPMAAL